LSLNRHNPKRDASEPGIVNALEAAGYWVVRVDKPLDLIVGRRGYERIILLECKSKGGSLTADQLKFMQISEGATRFVVFTPEQALAAADTWITNCERIEHQANS